MYIDKQDRWEPVILSAAKNLRVASEILRCAQNDNSRFSTKHHRAQDGDDNQQTCDFKREREAMK